MAHEALMWPSEEQIHPSTRSGLILEKENVTEKDPLKLNEEGLYGFLGHVITWHDYKVGDHGNVRIFIYSLARNSARRDLIAVEVEKHGAIFLPITQPEAQARLNLAMVRSAWALEHAFNSSLFRSLPSGRALEDHAREIDLYMKSLAKNLGNVVELMDRPRKTSKPPKGGWEFSSSQKDSIILAKLYAIRSEGSTTRVAKRICEDLGIETSVLYTAVRVARSKGWLTDGRKGKTGGTMTAEGEAFFLANDGPARLEKITGIKLGK